MKQLTKDEAIAFYDGDEWKTYTDQQIVDLQLFQDKLCVPFDRFHEAIERVLGRPVWTHEFANQQRLIDEYQRERGKPLMQEIIDMVPAEKLIVITK